MPFADDLRKYPFASLERLVNKKGEIVTKHPYLPTQEQMDAMENFVDAMDLMEAGEKDENGCVDSLPCSIYITYFFHDAIASDSHGLRPTCRSTRPFIV
jgi:hypothetical protein